MATPDILAVACMAGFLGPVFTGCGIWEPPANFFRSPFSSRSLTLGRLLTPHAGECNVEEHCSHTMDTLKALAFLLDFWCCGLDPTSSTPDLGHDSNSGKMTEGSF